MTTYPYFHTRQSEGDPNEWNIWKQLTPARKELVGKADSRAEAEELIAELERKDAA